MKTKCYSVRLAELIPLSDRACKAISFDGSVAIIPTSQIYGRDWDVMKSDAYWISAWILGKKELQYTCKKEAWFDTCTRKMLPTYIIEKHKPEKLSPKVENEIDELKSE